MFVLDTTNWESRRLTFLGGDTRATGWSRDSRRVIFATNAGAPFGRVFQLGSVPVEGGLTELLPWGPAAHIDYAPKKGAVLGRHTWDPARWKRYRGGTAGQLWVDPKEKGEFEVLIELDGNLTRPLWVGKRIYFGSDHEGVCNLYSCKPDGRGLQRHTDHEDFYLRHPASDGERIVYQAGGDLYLFDPTKKKSKRIQIELRSPKPQRARKFVNPYHYFEGYDLKKEGDQLAVTVRGRPFAFANWEGAVHQFGERDGVRYRCARWAGDKVLCVSDANGEERLELHQRGEEPELIGEDYDIGRALGLEVAPDGKLALLANHRHELHLVDLEERTVRLIERNPFSRINGACWSPDSKWIPYSFNISRQDAEIRLFEVATGEIRAVTGSAFYDFAPDFDPDGNYLYFLSCRDFDPVRDNIFFELSFPKGVKPYLVTLRADQPDPFRPIPRGPGEDPKKPTPKSDDKAEEKAEEATEEAVEEGAEEKPADEDKPKKEESKDKPITIDFEGIQQRVLAFPVGEGRYGKIMGLPGKVLFSYYPVESALVRDDSRRPAAKGTIYCFEWKTLETAEHISQVTNFRLSPNRKTLAYRSGNRLRLVPAGKKPDNNGTSPSRKSGYVELNRLRVSIIPTLEWKQMFREAWRLMRDHFWDEAMSGVDWQAVYEHYLPLLDRVGTRYELSDLLWEFQGELGTSHAYEYGGDYRSGPYYSQGKLAADFVWDKKAKAYRISHISIGDSWNDEQTSPLARPALR
ncbi:MAG: PD40 domain-containing protein, partial [Candidatus Eremiobacteraeota bacterium]|nr:PD40 domain-containing protein [Candidatus Eremiobacteraeota bacterium]